jgi:hypothetical protein
VANTFKTEADNLAAIASALVSKDILLAATVNRDYDREFAGVRGATVNVRIPAALASSTMALDATTRTLTASTIVETTQAVALTTNVYNATVLTDEDLTLRVDSFSERVLAPQALAVAEGLENIVVGKLQSVAETAGLDTVYTMGTTSTVLPLFITARKMLRDMSCPASGLFAAVGTGVYADVLAYNAGVGAYGGNGDSLANSGVTRMGGFTVIESNRLAATEAIFYHRDAITLVLRAPVVPAGATAGGTAASNGMAMRWLRDYDYANTSDRSIVNVYAGAALLNAQVSSTGTPANFILRVNDGAGT